MPKAKKKSKRATEEKARRRRARRRAEDLLAFLDASPCAFHAVETLRARFEEAGFVVVDERERFDLSPGDRVVVTRNGTALVALVVGKKLPSASGFRMLAAHTDSPGLRLKPNPETVSDGIVRLGVEMYGGPILATWTDRDLGLCGRVVLSGRGGRLESRLVRTGPIVSLPNVAIHLNREVNKSGLKLNPQTEMTVLLGTVEEGVPEADAVRVLLAGELGVKAERILDFELYLCDTLPGSFGGANDEFVRSGRLDDLAMCHASTLALLDAVKKPADATRMVVCYDSEEVGSRTPQGARSNFLPSVLERVALARGDDREGYMAALVASRMVSADNAHAIHPGYMEAHEPNHAPRLNGGPVIKIHASRAYATDAVSSAFFEQACRAAKVPVQRFVNRSDTRSGGTIGSMTAAQLGIPIADVGSAQYAMHSIREMAGTWDHDHMTEAMKAFLAG